MGGANSRSFSGEVDVMSETERLQSDCSEELKSEQTDSASRCFCTFIVFAKDAFPVFLFFFCLIGPALYDMQMFLCETLTNVLDLLQDRGGEVRHLLPAVSGADAAERRAGSPAVTHGDHLHPAEEPVPPLPAVQHPCPLHEQHVPGKADGCGRLQTAADGCGRLQKQTAS